MVAFKLFTSVAVATLLVAGAAQAREVTIVNPGFEEGPELGDGGFRESSFGGTPGWAGTSNTGKQNPTVGENGMFSALPGEQNTYTAYVNGGGGAELSLSQQLEEQLTANMNYVLAVDVGNRRDTPFPGFAFELLAGDNVLARFEGDEDDVAKGVFERFELNFSSVGISSDLLGLNLGIRLLSMGLQTNFDNVTLDVTEADTPVETPEPAALGLLGLGLAGLGFARSRR